MSPALACEREGPGVEAGADVLSEREQREAGLEATDAAHARYECPTPPDSRRKKIANKLLRPQRALQPVWQRWFTVPQAERTLARWDAAVLQTDF